MEKYDPILVGWGIDLLISWVLTNRNDYKPNKIAILDIVSCINPHDKAKGNIREISKLQSTKKRIEVYHQFAKIMLILLPMISKPINISTCNYFH